MYSSSCCLQFTYRSYWQLGNQDGKAAVDQESEKAIEKEGEAKGEADPAKSSDSADRASNVNNTGNARGNRSATNGDGERRDDDEYVTEEMDAELAKHFGDVAKNTMFQIRSKEKDTSTNEADSRTNENGANGAFGRLEQGEEQNQSSDNTLKKKKKSAKKKRMTLAELKFWLHTRK